MNYHRIAARSAIAIITLLTPGIAKAQACPTSPGPGPCYGEKCCDPSLNGNPVHMTKSSTFYRHRDFTVAAPGGDFEFLRTFMSDPTKWMYWTSTMYPMLTGIPVPFGNAPSGSPLYIGGPMRWFHNLFAVVYATPIGDTSPSAGIYVRDMSGGLAQFATCGSSCALVGGWAAPHAQAPSSYGKMRVLNSRTNPTYEYTQPNGVVLVFDKQYNSTSYYFLRKALNLARQVWFEIVYYENPAVVPNCPILSPTGVPYIKEVRLDPAGGPVPSLQFNYSEVINITPARACLLRSIAYRPVLGNDTVLVTYGYHEDGGVASLASATLADGTSSEAYSYGVTDTLFRRDRDGDFTSQHDLGTLGGHGFAVTYASASGQLNRSFGGASGAIHADVSTRSGETLPTGMSQLITLTQTYTSSPQTCLRNEVTLTSRIDSLLVGQEEFGSAGTYSWHYGLIDESSSCSKNNPGVLKRETNKLNHSTIYEYRTHIIAGEVYPYRIAEGRGVDGTQDSSTALESHRYSYAYDDNNFQQLEDHTRNSLIKVVPGASPQTTVRRLYEAGTSRLAGVISHGWTRDYQGNEMEKYYATFYKIARGCQAPTTDPYKRTLRIEGPCDVTSIGYSATSCAGTYPVTEFQYYDLSSGNELKAGRLHKVIQYPEPCMHPLTTEYTAYNALGMPTNMLDVNGIEMRMEYKDGRITKRSTTVAGISRDTLYVYDSAEHLIQVTYPKGNLERFCYRSEADAQCLGGTLRNALLWKAKYPSATSANWTERVDYSAWGVDVGVTHYRNPSETRNTVTRFTDAHDRPTSEGIGYKLDICNSSDLCGPGPTSSTKRRFDGADNVIKLGLPFNQAPDFCTNNSTLCSWLTYDRGERLAGVDTHPDTSPLPTANSTRTCFEYDAHGNVRRVATGCSGAAGASACPINNTGALQSSCAASSTDYEHDDFGNVVTVTSPWTSETARAITRYEYDPSGNVVRKQTTEMRAAGIPVYIKYSYDLMGRLTSASREGGAAITLYTLGYDNNENVETGCLGPLVHSNGRLAMRNDAFGKTWYQYDEEGRVTKEIRLRSLYVGVGCSGPAAEDRSPTTSYSYDANGNLSGIVYPHGRAVEYVYSSSSPDRPESIKHSAWNGSTWNATWNPVSSLWTETPTTVIDNITWEPYGGLRAYKLFHSGKWVEYYRGGGMETRPKQTACVDLPATYTDPGMQAHDRSGRLRGLLVSDGPFSPGAPNGAVFKQIYTWKADMLTSQQTCFGSAGQVLADDFSYDRSLRLTGVSVSAGASSSSAEFFEYDARGNRTATSLTMPTCRVQSTPGTLAHQVDLLAAQRWGASDCNGAVGGYAYSYDRDGRQSQMGDKSGNFQVTAAYGSYAQSADSLALDSVFQSATISRGGNTGATYTYYYDAFGRRIAKHTPWSSMDEYFYDLGHQLLSDRGADTVGSTPSEYPEDDYIWLDGRPVVVVRSKFNTSWVRQPEWPYVYTYCARNAATSGETDVCGTNYPITDYLGKPVVMLSDGVLSAGVVGSARYHAFGHAHRRDAYFASPHGGNRQTSVMTIDDYVPPGFGAFARILFSKIDEANEGIISLGGTLQNFSVGAHLWSTWVYRVATGWDLLHQGTSKYGFDMEAYEVKVKQLGVHGFWIPLRLPGQYYDDETELHESWNRYYDASIGRYLQPEPMLRDPEFVAQRAKRSQILPPYSYALNNPISLTDPDGLGPEAPCNQSDTTYSCCIKRHPGNLQQCGHPDTDSPAPVTPPVVPDLGPAAAAKLLCEQTEKKKMCTDHYEKCQDEGGGYRPGRVSGESLCASCLAYCADPANGYWPTALYSWRGTPLPCPGQ